MKFQIKTNSLNFQLKNAVIKEYPELENIEITPSKEQQTFKSENYYGYDEVKVNAVTSEIDSNIKPENIKEGVSILGVSGNANILNGEELTITKNGEYIPTEPINAYTKVIADVPNDTSDATATAGDIATGKTAYIASGLVEGTGTISTPVTKGLVINSYDDEGFPIDVSLVGMTKIPTYYFYYIFGKTSNKEPLFSRVGANLHLPDSITSIEDFAFEYCNTLALTSLPNSITSIGYYTFYGCTNLALTSLPSNLTYINTSAFANCVNITINELPESLTVLQGSAFSGCSNLKLTSIPSGVTKLRSYTFGRCTSLTELTIKGNVTDIDSDVFYNCSKLAKIVFPNVTKVPTLSNTDAFGSTPIANGTGYIYVPDSLVDSIKSATNWSTYADQIKGVSELV